MEVTFESCTKGVVIYSIPALNLAGEVPIWRIANENLAICEGLSGQ